MLTNTGLSFDVSSIIPLINKVKWDDKGRCQLNDPTGNWLYDPYTVKPEWKGTSLEDLLTLLEQSYSIGEARLMKMTPGTCYQSHADIDDRIHFNITSNDQSYLVDLDSKKMYQLETDNLIYYMDASHRHIAANFGCTDRIQLVVRVRLTRIDNSQFVKKTIQFRTLPANFRYIFDNTVSPFISKKIKTGDIGFFNLITDTRLELILTEETFKHLLIYLEKIHKDFIIND